jgi:[CysO sulfur-carrier protein]-S-L-cysteine hydrolase
MKQPPEKLILPEDLRQEMMNHVREALPMEGVGLLGGDADGRVLLVKRLKNIAGRRSFLADPFEQFQAERSLKRRGLSLIAVYHSHPEGGAQLSADDLAFASLRPVLHVIIALARAPVLADEIQAYRIKDGIPIAIKIYSEGGQS